MSEQFQIGVTERLLTYRSPKRKPPRRPQWTIQAMLVFTAATAAGCTFYVAMHDRIVRIWELHYRHPEIDFWVLRSADILWFCFLGLVLAALACWVTWRVAVRRSTARNPPAN